MGDNQTSPDSLKITAQLTLLQRLSAQAATLIALIDALTQGIGHVITVYSDSTYATTTVHSSMSV